MPNKAPRMHSFSGCGSPELPAVVLTRTPLQEASDLHRLSAPDGKFVAAERENLVPAAPFPTLILAHRTNSLLDLRLYHRRSFESELFFLEN